VEAIEADVAGVGGGSGLILMIESRYMSVYRSYFDETLDKLYLTAYL
jgi:hypothetical protein